MLLVNFNYLINFPPVCLAIALIIFLMLIADYFHWFIVFYRLLLPPFILYALSEVTDDFRALAVIYNRSVNRFNLYLTPSFIYVIATIITLFPVIYLYKIHIQ
ncbi:hypothetical protein COO59_09010 [Mixta theicola]|uniref:Colicin transporter n=1 Tax=Mixta theicola TaxID=1458355 RepID=A0A2K1QAS4_9GAMM|nr:hypothetical protein COO59_09010 [Mixta theicola]